MSAKGGVWYTGDAGATWAPVGGWATRSVNPQGNGNLVSGGALLVDFTGGLAALDVVLFGTGEPTPATTATGSSAQGGMGVLAALGTHVRPGRRRSRGSPTPARRCSPGSASGVSRGIRVPPPSRRRPAPPRTACSRRRPTGCTWAPGRACRTFPSHRRRGRDCRPNLNCRCVTASPCAPAAPHPRSPGTTSPTRVARQRSRNAIVYALRGRGVFVSDDSGATGVPIVGLQFPGVRFLNRISLTVVAGTSRMYVLAEVRVGGVPTPSLFRSSTRWPARRWWYRSPEFRGISSAIRRSHRPRVGTTTGWPPRPSAGTIGSISAARRCTCTTAANRIGAARSTASRRRLPLPPSPR